MTLPENLRSHVTVQLMKGVLYQDKHPELWNALLNFQIAVRDYVAIIGLELVIDESESYAFLRQRHMTEEYENENTPTLPRLIQRRPLSYPVSLLCLLLRKKLIENDTIGGNTRVILTHQQILDMMTVFLLDRVNEVKTKEQIETCINKLLDFGFLRRLKNDTAHYEVQRIIKALIDAEWLSDIANKLQEYQEHGQSSTI
jgi:hypothetical protein